MPYRFEDMQRAFLVALADLCALCLLSSERADADAIREAEYAAGNGLRAMSGTYGVSRMTNGSGSENGNGSGVIDLRTASGRDVKLTAREQEIAIALTQG